MTSRAVPCFQFWFLLKTGNVSQQPVLVTLDRCLEKLPQEKRELVCAAYAPGARIDRLAETMGRTAMALYKELHRLRLALLECTRKEMASQDLS